MNNDDFVELHEIPTDKPIAIYGAGEAGDNLRKDLFKQFNVSISFFIDSFKEGEIDGFPVYKFHSINREKLEKVCIIVASCFWRDILVNLNKSYWINYFIYRENPQTLISKSTKLLENCWDKYINSPVSYLGCNQACMEKEKVVIIHDSIITIHNTSDIVPCKDNFIVWEGALNNINVNTIRKKLDKLDYSCVILCPLNWGHYNFLFLVSSCLPISSKIYVTPPCSHKYACFIFKESNSIYFPIAKCASSTLLCHFNNLSENASQLDIHYPTSANKTLTLLTYTEISNKYSDYFKFTFVRNPFTRIETLYKTKEHIYNYISKNNMSLKDFIKFISKCPNFISDVHFRAQHTFITNNNGELFIDYIGKIESFNADYENIRTHIKIPKPKIFKNASRATKHNKISQLDSNDKKMIYKRYHYDFELFGYDPN
jgi:hypothetical protein